MAFITISGGASALACGFSVLKKFRQQRHLFLAYNGKVTERANRRMVKGRLRSPKRAIREHKRRPNFQRGHVKAPKQTFYPIGKATKKRFLVTATLHDPH